MDKESLLAYLIVFSILGVFCLLCYRVFKPRLSERQSKAVSGLSVMALVVLFTGAWRQSQYPTVKNISPPNPYRLLPDPGDVYSDPPPGYSCGLPYTMVTPPNPTIDWGIAAIVPTRQNISASKAAILAAIARKTFAGTKNRAFQIFVFADSQSAQIFGKYQAKRRGARLSDANYRALSQIWPCCLACVEFNRARQIVRYPSQQPIGWWKLH